MTSTTSKSRKRSRCSNRPFRLLGLMFVLQMANRGQFKPGESGNPSGRGIRKATSAPGYDGVQAYSGYVVTGEGDGRLRGAQRWKTFANLFRTCPPVPIWARLRDRLLSGITWSLVPNEAGTAGSAAERTQAER